VPVADGLALDSEPLLITAERVVSGVERLAVDVAVREDIRSLLPGIHDDREALTHGLPFTTALLLSPLVFDLPEVGRADVRILISVFSFKLFIVKRWVLAKKVTDKRTDTSSLSGGTTVHLSMPVQIKNTTSHPHITIHAITKQSETTHDEAFVELLNLLAVKSSR